MHISPGSGLQKVTGGEARQAWQQSSFVLHRDATPSSTQSRGSRDAQGGAVIVWKKVFSRGWGDSQVSPGAVTSYTPPKNSVSRHLIKTVGENARGKTRGFSETKEQIKPQSCHPNSIFLEMFMLQLPTRGLQSSSP